MSLGRSVDELISSLSLKEFVEWIAFYNLEPWGSEVSGMRDAVTASTVANAGLMVANPKQLKKKPFKPLDFMVGSKKIKVVNKKMDWREQRKILDSLLKGKLKKR